ncbi:hypothetical protein QJQ45_015250 [Haematococcus lacustris]|nr:hypothetical protein QJQ45_015250 [Haematococcus lacustris]
MACMKSDGDCGGGAGPAHEPLDPAGAEESVSDSDSGQGVTQAQCSDPHVRPQAAAAGRKRAYAGKSQGHAARNTLHQLVAGQGSLPLVHPSLLQPPSDRQTLSEHFGSHTELSDNLASGVDNSHRYEPADMKTPLTSHHAHAPAPSSAPPPSHQPPRSPSHGPPASHLPPSCHGAHPAPSPSPPQLVGVEWIRQQHLLRQQQPWPAHLSTLGTAPTGLAAARVMAAAMAQPDKVAGPGTPAGYAPVVINHAARYQPDSLAAELDPHGSLFAHSGDKVQELATRVCAAAVSGEPYLAFTEPRPALCEWCQAPDHTVGSCPVWLLLAPSATSPPPTSPVPGAERTQQSDQAARTAGHMAKKMKVSGTLAASARTDDASAAVAAVWAASLVVPNLAWD